jgi:electron transfer flavoprotein beta subunit
VKGTIVGRFLSGELTVDEAVKLLEREKDVLDEFVVVAGIKTTDGETGSVGPQVSEALSELLGKVVPHVTYVDDFEIDPVTRVIEAERRIGRLVQRMRMNSPALLTVADEYRPREPGVHQQLLVRENSYKEKIRQPMKWAAEDLGADASRLGLSGSPTWVGPGIEVGKPPVQKFIGRSQVFFLKSDSIDWEGKKLGPFDRGDLADNLPEGLKKELAEKKVIGTFDVKMLVDETLP